MEWRMGGGVEGEKKPWVCRPLLYVSLSLNRVAFLRMRDMATGLGLPVGSNARATDCSVLAYAS